MNNQQQFEEFLARRNQQREAVKVRLAEKDKEVRKFARLVVAVSK